MQAKKGIISRGLALYKTSFLNTLWMSLCIILLVDFSLYGNAIIPAQYQDFYSKAAMVILLFSLPILGLMIKQMHNLAKAHQQTFMDLVSFVANRFIPLMMAFLSMLFIPVIIIGFGVGGFFWMQKTQVNPNFILAWKIFIVLAILASIVPKIFAPIVVITNAEENPIDYSDKLVKGHFIRTFFYSLGITLIISLIAMQKDIIKNYLPSVFQSMPEIGWVIVGQVLFLFLIPLFVALFLSQLYNLQENGLTRLRGKPGEAS